MQNQLHVLPPEDELALGTLTDEELVSICKRELPDEINAYRELVKRYEGLIYNFCLKTIGSAQDAEEVAQDSLIQVFHKIHQFENRSAFKTWLYKIVHNYCRNRISKISRKQKNQRAYEEQVSKEPATQDKSNAQSQDNKERIQDALDRLKPKDKEIITYKFILGMTLQEIAETLGLGSSAAKMRFYRALESFKAAYQRTDSEIQTPSVKL
ncbi:RNA polymerase sigma factor [Puniceicoccaceae bacterium K14]|nr:RNA polymerase sigma factor [Puniceicoccaceae bacterium K14]